MVFVLLLMRLILSGVFIYSGFSKLIAPLENFAAVIEAYQFLKPEWIQPVSFFLPWLELSFGAFLLAGFLTRFSSAFLAFFLLVFMSLLARSLVLKLPVADCGCFGAGISLAPQQALLLDSGLFLLALCLIIFPPRLLSLDERLKQ